MVEQEYFTELLLEDQHRELLEKLSEILNAIPSPDNADVISAISKNGELINGFIEAVRAIKFPTPQVNVEQIETQLDVFQIVKTLTENTEKIIESNDKVFSQLKELNRLKEWTFDFRRSEGVILSPIIAKQIK